MRRRRPKIVEALRASNLRERLRPILGAVLGVTLAASTLLGVPAEAAPYTPLVGQAIDGYAAYDGQDTCDPTAKPGVVDFRARLNDAYGDHTGYITRACSDGGQSEHKEGRALDYMLSVYNTGEQAIADDILDWLLATDRYGNTHANARRLGIMYLIWNKRIWKSYQASSGWQTYTGSNPHTDHIHFSFSWNGAWKSTTYWKVATHAVSGDWNGDGVFTPGVVSWNGSHWYFQLRDSNTSGPATTEFAFGGVDDIPVVGDWDGNGTWTAGVVRYDRGYWRWLLKQTLGGGTADVDFRYARADTVPVVGDWDGNGSTTPGVVDYRSGAPKWFLRNSLSGGDADVEPFTYGALGMVPVVGDWNGDGKWTPGLVNNVSGHRRWYLKNSLTGGAADITYDYAAAGALPISGDWNGSADGSRAVTPGAVLNSGDNRIWYLKTNPGGGTADITYTYGPSGLYPL